MLYQLLLVLIKVFVGTTLGLMGVYSAGVKKNKIKKMRIFDELNLTTKIQILETAIAYAKKDIEENNLEVDLFAHACGFGEMFLLQEGDFGLINTTVITGWVGSTPPHRPKAW